MKSRIMYIERKAGALTGTARIGRVTFNRTGKTIYYRDQVFRRIVGGGFKSNYLEESTGEDYWISGPSATAAIDFTADVSPSRSMRTFARSTGPRFGTSQMNASPNVPN